MTLSLILAFAVAFIVSALIGKYLVPWLREIKAGQMIKEIGPTWHMSKQGTPTMGGVMFIAGTAIACITAGFQYMLDGQYAHIIVLLFAMAFGAIGFIDDFEKLKKRQNTGLTAGKKFFLQVAVAALLVAALRVTNNLTPNLWIPFFNVTWYLPEWLYYAFAVFVIVATVNAVNLTDGADGLATGTSIPVFVFFAAVALTWGAEFASLGVFSSALVGALFGFLIYNFNPAKVFMGDTGSLFLGGAVAGVALAMNMPLIIITVGLLYIIEVLSDVIQVGYFKLTHGKRVFRMAPFHHHLEMGGWSGHKWTEKQLFALFTGISLLMAILSFAGVFGRYGA